jgi:hypothetical protein
LIESRTIPAAFHAGAWLQVVPRRFFFTSRLTFLYRTQDENLVRDLGFIDFI